MPSLNSYLPGHLKHLQHTCLFQSLGKTMEEFLDNGLISNETAGELMQITASRLEDEFEESQIPSSSIRISPGEGIVNYRYDEGYWELVVEGPVELELEDGTQVTAGLVGIEGCGGGLTKGKKEGAKLKAAHTRQQALDEQSEDSFSSS
jgi:hypothetical protein